MSDIFNNIFKELILSTENEYNITPELDMLLRLNDNNLFLYRLYNEIKKAASGKHNLPLSEVIYKAIDGFIDCKKRYDQINKITLYGYEKDLDAFFVLSADDHLVSDIESTLALYSDFKDIDEDIIFGTEETGLKIFEYRYFRKIVPVDAINAKKKENNELITTNSIDTIKANPKNWYVEWNDKFYYIGRVLNIKKIKDKEYLLITDTELTDI